MMSFDRLLLVAVLAIALPCRAADPLTGWLLLGPMPITAQAEQAPTQAEQKAFFNAHQVNPESTIGVKPGQAFPYGNARLLWQPAPASADGAIDLEAFFGPADYAAAYAYLEWEESSAREVVLGIGSDDGIRIWHNGKLLHEFMGGRELTPAEDLVKATLAPGLNRLLVKVQDLEYAWGFSISIMQPADFGDRLVQSAGAGNLDGIALLLGLGTDVNHVSSSSGLTAWQMARMKGRSKAMEALEKAGADLRKPMPDKSLLADRWIQHYIEPADAGVSVLVSENGNILYQKAFGMADVAAERPLTTNSSFRIGSVTKQFTATAILLLVQDGKLKLDQKLEEFYPEVANADRISIRQMLNHTAGIRSYTESEGFMESLTKYEDPKKMEARIAGYKPDFEPGESWMYSNSGYYLLGRIAERVSGQSLGQFWQERIFEPLGMTRSSLYDNRLRIARPDEALGHSWEGGKYVRAQDWDMSWVAGAGAISSTTEDLFRWNEAVFGGKVLNADLLREAHTPAKLNNGQQAEALGSSYGFGWMPDENRGLAMIGHTGGLHGFSSDLTRLPAQKATITVLMNAMPGKNVSPSAMVQALAEIFFYEQMSAQESFASVNIDTAVLRDYEGRYGYPGGAVLTVRADQGRLFGQLTGQEEFELFAEAPDRFFWKVVAASLAFTRNDKGQVTGGVHSQGGRNMKVQKLADAKEVSLSNAVLDRYTGTYDLRGMELSVQRRDNSLFLVMGDQPDMEIFPSSETEFFLKSVQATVVFETDTEGRAVQLLINQGGIEMEATRKP
ncbi:MAG: serine hydrolase [Bacteroidetes bacterium]|nr:serine hydrolase [Bacteroidota bacterium]